MAHAHSHIRHTQAKHFKYFMGVDVQKTEMLLWFMGQGEGGGASHIYRIVLRYIVSVRHGLQVVIDEAMTVSIVDFPHLWKGKQACKLS